MHLYLANFKLVISYYAAIYAFAHSHIHVIFTVKITFENTLKLFEQHDSQCTQTSQNTECAVSLIFVYFFILNIYLFVKKYFVI